MIYPDLSGSLYFLKKERRHSIFWRRHREFVNCWKPFLWNLRERGKNKSLQKWFNNFSNYYRMEEPFFLGSVVTYQFSTVNFPIIITKWFKKELIKSFFTSNFLNQKNGGVIYFNNNNVNITIRNTIFANNSAASVRFFKN